MNTIELILLVIGLICFVAAAIGVAAGRVNLVAAGLAFWILVVIINAVPK